VPGKRQHYVPSFVLRRFAIPSERRTLVARLDKATREIACRNPVNEAVRSRYYRIVHDDGTIDDTADDVLDRIEDKAAPVVERLARPDSELTVEELVALAWFVATLKHRTPEGREELHEMDKRFAELDFEARLADRAHWHRVTRKHFDDDADCERWRRRLLADLRSGDIVFPRDERREVGLMFTSVEHIVAALMEKMRWVVLRTPPGRSFILGDHPVAHHDPTPKVQGAGAGWLSSPSAQTFVALDPSFALLFEPSTTTELVEGLVPPPQVDEFNALTHAWATAAIYASDEQVLRRHYEELERNPDHYARFRKRPPRVWIAEMPPGARGGIHQFRSRYGDETLVRELRVGDAAFD
jgi:hypothetical protein